MAGASGKQASRDRHAPLALVVRPGRGARLTTTGRVSAAWAMRSIVANALSEHSPVTSISTKCPPLPTLESRRRWLDEV